MPNVEARLKVKGKQYEISVDLDEALKIKNSQGDVTTALQSPQIYYDLRKGTIASHSDLQEAFSTTDTYEIAKRIIQKGEVQKTQEYRDEEREKKVKQVINLIIENATDQNGRPYTEERIPLAVRLFRSRRLSPQDPIASDRIAPSVSFLSQGIDPAEVCLRSMDEHSRSAQWTLRERVSEGCPRRFNQLLSAGPEPSSAASFSSWRSWRPSCSPSPARSSG